MPDSSRQHQPLAGQRALVTGASSGIGRATALALAQAGAAVAVNWVSGEEAAQAVVREIEAVGSKAIAVRADVSNEQEVQAMFAHVIAEWGSLDILVNNAGLQKDSPVHLMSLAAWSFVIAVNLTGQFLCAREAVREFLRRGVIAELSRAAGKILCMSSVHDAIPWAGHANYAASKGGVAMLMKTLAQELAGKHIRVNSISPGAIQTSINRAAWETPTALGALLQHIPYGRIGEPEDIGKAAVWLASDDSDYVNGATLYIDGGMTLYPEFREGG